MPLLVEGTLNELQIEVIDSVVRMAKLVGLPKSVGEIFGLLYCSPEPLPMDRIIELLQISLSSASQGLKVLRSFRAVRVCYIPGDRRDHFEAEESFRKLLTNFVKEEMEPHFESGKDRIQRMEVLLKNMTDEERSFYTGRVDRLKSLNKAAYKLLPLIARIINV